MQPWEARFISEPWDYPLCNLTFIGRQNTEGREFTRAPCPLLLRNLNAPYSQVTRSAGRM